MTREEFNNITRILALTAVTLEGLDLAGYIEDIDRDEAFGCFTDAPTRWKDRRAVCDRLRDMARAALAFRNRGVAAQEQAILEVVKEAGRRTRAQEGHTP